MIIISNSIIIMNFSLMHLLSLDQLCVPVPEEE